MSLKNPKTFRKYEQNLQFQMPELQLLKWCWTPKKAYNFIFLTETPSKNMTFKKAPQVKIMSKSKVMPVCIFWLWRNLCQDGWVFIYKLSGCGFASSCSHLNFRFRTCFEGGVLDIQATIECRITLNSVRGSFYLDMLASFSLIFLNIDTN